MKMITAITLTTLASCATLTYSIREAPAPEKRVMEIADLYRCATIGAPSLTKDGALIAFSVKHTDLEASKSWSDIWIVAADGSGLRQMTCGKNTDTDPHFSPDGKQLLFSSTRSGDGQLWIMATDGGEPRKLTDFPGGVANAQWSPNGKYIAATADVFPECNLDDACLKKNAEGLEKGKLKVHVTDDLLYRHWTSWADGKRSHIVMLDAESGKVRKDLTPGPWESPTFSLGERGFAFAPDSSELCYVSNHEKDEASSTNTDLFVVPIEGDITPETARNITATNKGWDGEPLYSPDGRTIAFISQEQAGYESDLKKLVLYERNTRTTTELTNRKHFDDWVDDFRWTSDSQAIVFSAEYRGRTPLFRIPAHGGDPEQVLVHGSIGGFELTPDNQGAVYMRRTIGEPSELFHARFAAADKTRLTSFNAPIEKEIDFRAPEELWIQGDGDYKVHCFVVKPHGFDASKKYPLILNVHGGPQSQWADAFRGDWQVYPAKGYVVAFCNPTGSTGYGQALTDGITGDWGGRVYRDLMRVTDELEKLPYVDKNRMGAMGWSYGGYMTMWMQGHTMRFKCIASMMGVYDLEAEYGATEELWFPEHDFRGTPWTSDDYVKWSPSQSVKSFKTPALVITGELDYRVPYTQSLAYYTALRKMNVPARLVVFPGAGHWPSWNEMAFYYNAHLDFFHHYLGGEPAPYDVKEHARNLAFEKKDKQPAATTTN